MPELPEVETICSGLRAGWQGKDSLIGRKIIKAWVFWQRTIAIPGVDEFIQKISGEHIENIRRRGKFIIIGLKSYELLIHLRMSGDLLVRSSAEGFLVHDRVALEFSDGEILAFNDPRKFGRLWLVQDVAEVIGDLGPEPFDISLDNEKFLMMLRGRSRQLKPLLMDQTFLAGMGNIYTDEALFVAGLHPLLVSDQVTGEQAQRLLKSIRQVLLEGIHHQGASIDWVYRGGDFQNYFRVYRRTGEPCPVCHTPIQRIIVGQRSTHYCPRCQPR